jgi:hypothetical protein
MAKSVPTRSATPSGPTRQHYQMATGAKVDGKSLPNKGPKPMPQSKSKPGKK